MGKQNSHADRNYIVSPQASSVTVEFTLYEIDEWELDDKFTVIINSRRIDLGQFFENDLVENPFNFKSGSKAGIIWLRYSVTPAMKVAFNSTYADQAHKVEMRIPPSYYSNGSLEIEMRATMDDVIENESAGIDNLKVMAHGLCSTSTPLNTGSTISQHVQVGPDRLLEGNQSS
jgi:hypothetical protein